jgi:hypothetical protein
MVIQLLVTVKKIGWCLMFWSGADFGDEKLNVLSKKFRDASIFYTSVEQINAKDLNVSLKNQKNSVGL